MKNSKKTLLVVLFVIATLMSLIAISSVSASAETTGTNPSTAPTYICGDVDMDGVVTIKDATRIQEIVARIIRDLSDEGVVCCYSDVNYDFKINVVWF